LLNARNGCFWGCAIDLLLSSLPQSTTSISLGLLN